MTTTQDYQAAERLLRRPAIPGELVVGDKVNPQWIDGGTRFWYAVSNGAGPRFVLLSVDVIAYADAALAFDQQALS